MKHNISKLTILSCLLLRTIANAQNFYTCVPKDDWFNKRFDTRMLYEKFETAKTQINNDNAWEILYENTTNKTLYSGIIYRVIVAGGAGGNGGDAGKSGGYGAGGVGEVKKEVFLLDKNAVFFACYGEAGKSGNYGSYGGSGGSGGGGSAFLLPYKDIRISVSGGGGGGGDSSCSAMNCHIRNKSGGGGGGGGGFGCAHGGKGGEGDGGAAVGYSSVYGIYFKPFEVGNNGGEDSVSEGGYGGAGGKSCANGGRGGSYNGDGYNGGSCASSGNGNSGDGYVRIYKYIG